MLPTLSPEGQVDSILRSVNCSGRAFLDIVRAKGLDVPQTAFVRALHPDPAKRKSFHHKTGAKLVEIARLMRDVQNNFAEVPIAWAESDKVAWLVTWMMSKQVAQEAGLTDLANTADAAVNYEFRAEFKGVGAL